MEINLRVGREGDNELLQLKLNSADLTDIRNT